MCLIDQLDSLHIDWSDFEKAGEISRSIACDLATDRAALGELVRRTGEDPQLLAMSERHQLLDYLVVYDALDRGFRIRVHMSTDDHFDRPHDHRFSFSSYIAAGGYQHTWYYVDADIYRRSDEDTLPYQSRFEPDPEAVPLLNSLKPHLTRFERPGDCYTLEHTAIHTTFTLPDTVSIFVRGSAAKRRSIIMDEKLGSVWWRFGRQDESQSRRSQKQMSVADYHATCARLKELGVI